jgi:hypothetical protein
VSDRTDQSALKAIAVEVLKYCAAAAVPCVGALMYVAGLDTRITLLERTQVTPKDLEVMSKELRGAVREELAPVNKLLERHDADLRSLDARVVRHEATDRKVSQ